MNHFIALAHAGHGHTDGLAHWLAEPQHIPFVIAAVGVVGVLAIVAVSRASRAWKRTSHRD